MAIVKHYRVTLTSDIGVFHIDTAATSAEAAVEIVLKAENAPRTAVAAVYQILLKQIECDGEGKYTD